MLTDAQLKAWKSVTDGATSEPWEVANVSGWQVLAGPLTENRPGLTRGGRGTIAEMDRDDFGLETQERNALFFAVARSAMPALLAEVERLRTPANENVGRAGFDAYARQRAADGLPPSREWATMATEAPLVAGAWVAAGHAERAVAYALAADQVTCGDVSEIQRRILRLGQPPVNATERLARIAALLREAGSLAVEVVADGDAPEEQRATAEAIRAKLSEDHDEQARLDGLRCWAVRFKHGPPGDDVPPSIDALKGAQASAATALDMARLAARRSSSAPLGRALGALEMAVEQLAAARKLEPEARVIGQASGTYEADQEKTPTSPSELLKDGDA